MAAPEPWLQAMRFETDGQNLFRQRDPFKTESNDVQKGLVALQGAGKGDGYDDPVVASMTRERPDQLLGAKLTADQPMLEVDEQMLHGAPVCQQHLLVLERFQ